MQLKTETVGQRIRRIRRDDLGLDQAPFGKKLGVGQGTVSAWERDDEDRAPSAEIYFRLATIAPQAKDKVFFLERAGLSRETIGIAANQLAREQIAHPKEGEMILVPRVRKTPQGLEPTGKPLSMPSEAVPNPLSTYCFVLEGLLAGHEVVVDMADAAAGNLLPFFGRLVLMEFPPDEPDLWPNGLSVGTLFGPRENRMPGRIDWLAEFIPLTFELIQSELLTVGMWTERRFEASRPLTQVSKGPVALAEAFRKQFVERAKKAFPQGEGETVEAWLARATDCLRQSNRMELTSPEFLAEISQIFAGIPLRVKQAASEMKLGSGCKVLGRVIASFRPPSKSGK